MNSEAWLRAQYQAAVKERDILQQRLEAKQKENDDLRKSVFELSYLMSLKSTAGNDFRIGDCLNRNAVTETVAPLVCSPLSPVTPGAHAGEIEGDIPSLKFEAELKGHTGAIYCAAFSSSGRWLASGSIDRTVRIWDGNMPYKQTNCFSDHTQLISDICWERGTKENRLLSVSYDRTVRLWDTERGECMHVTKLRAFGALVKVFPGGSGPLRGCAVVACTTPELNLVDPRVPAITSSWSHSCVVSSLVCMSSGSTEQLLIGDEQGQLSLYDLRQFDQPVCVWSTPIAPSELRVSVADLQTCTDYSGAVGTAAVSGNSSTMLLAAQCSDNSLRVYELSTCFSPHSAPASTAVASCLNSVSIGSESEMEGGTIESPGSEVLSADAISQGHNHNQVVDGTSNGVTGGSGGSNVSGGVVITGPPRLLQTLRGHSTGVWRIRCSFIRCRQCPDTTSVSRHAASILENDYLSETATAQATRSRSADGLNFLVQDDNDSLIEDIAIVALDSHSTRQRSPEPEKRHSHEEGSGAECNNDTVDQPSSRNRQRAVTGSLYGNHLNAGMMRHISVPGSILLATGSTAGQVLIYDVSGVADEADSVGAGNKASTIWQKLDGHAGKVYGAVFSPTDQRVNLNLLVTYGAEGILRVWGPNRRKSNF